MNQISIAEAVSVLSYINRRIGELQSERNSVRTAVVDKGEEAARPDRSVDVITDEILAAQADYRELKKLIALSNIVTTIEWDGQQISVMEAIELAKNKREEVATYKVLGRFKKIERERPSFGTATASGYTVALFEPEKYAALATKLERQVNALSRDIDRSNHNTMIEFDSSQYIA